LKEPKTEEKKLEELIEDIEKEENKSSEIHNYDNYNDYIEKYKKNPIVKLISDNELLNFLSTKYFFDNYFEKNNKYSVKRFFIYAILLFQIKKLINIDWKILYNYIDELENAKEIEKIKKMKRMENIKNAEFIENDDLKFYCIELNKCKGKLGNLKKMIESQNDITYIAKTCEEIKKINHDIGLLEKMKKEWESKCPIEFIYQNYKGDNFDYVKEIIKENVTGIKEIYRVHIYYSLEQQQDIYDKPLEEGKPAKILVRATDYFDKPITDKITITINKTIIETKPVTYNNKHYREFIINETSKSDVINVEYQGDNRRLILFK